MKVALDLHDFSVVHNRLGVLRSLKDHFPNFKVSLFTIPIDTPKNWGPYTMRHAFLEEIKGELDWIQLIPHGLNHLSSYEVDNLDYAHFKHEFIPAIEQAFNDDGLPFERGFCAPHWRWNSHVTKVLDDIDWWGAVDRRKKMHTPKRYYKYNFLLNEPFWEASEPVLKLHGHVYGTRNDIRECYENLLKLPKDVEWCYVTDFLEEKDV